MTDTCRKQPCIVGLIGGFQRAQLRISSAYTIVVDYVPAVCNVNFWFAAWCLHILVVTCQALFTSADTLAFLAFQDQLECRQYGLAL